MKIVVVDDERPARSELAFLITDILPEAEILEAASGAAALELFLSTPDICLAFLDINLNDMEGTTLAAAMQKILPDVPVVFATAYSEYAVRAFELGAADYILKPVEPDRLRSVLKKCMAVPGASLSVSDPMENKIAISFNRKVIFTDTKDIIYIETSGRGCMIHTVTDGYAENILIGDYEKRLSHLGFFRIHKSYLVNLAFVSEVFPWANNGLALKLKGCGSEIFPIGREKTKAFRQRMKI